MLRDTNHILIIITVVKNKVRTYKGARAVLKSLKKIPSLNTEFTDRQKEVKYR